MRALARTLRALSRVPSKVAAPFAEYVTKELQDGIRRGADPYGNALPALKAATVRRKGHADILQGATLQLLDTTAAKPLSSAGVGLEVGPSYAHFHITGTARMVARKFLPTNVMPAKWSAYLQKLLSERVRKALP